MRLSINQACERSEKSNIARKASKGSMQCSKERKRLGSSCKAANGRGRNAMQNTQKKQKGSMCLKQKRFIHDLFPFLSTPSSLYCSENEDEDKRRLVYIHGFRFCNLISQGEVERTLGCSYLTVEFGFFTGKFIDRG
jgi:hypothetical protein